MRTREGEVSPVPAPQTFSSMQSRKPYKSERQGGRGRGGNSPGKKEQRKGNKEGDTNTGSKKNQQTIESISEIDKLSRGG